MPEPRLPRPMVSKSLDSDVLAKFIRTMYKGTPEGRNLAFLEQLRDYYGNSHDAILRLLRPLDARSKLAIILLFGLDGKPPRSYATVASVLQRQETEARRLIRQALSKCRRESNRTIYKAFPKWQLQSSDGIEYLELSAWTYQALKRLRINTVGDLVEAIREDRLVPNRIDPHVQRKIKLKLKQHGFED